MGSLVSTGISKCRDVKYNMDCSILDGDHTSDPRYSAWGSAAYSASEMHFNTLIDLFAKITQTIYYVIKQKLNFTIIVHV